MGTVAFVIKNIFNCNALHLYRNKANAPVIGPSCQLINKPQIEWTSFDSINFLDGYTEPPKIHLQQSIWNFDRPQTWHLASICDVNCQSDALHGLHGVQIVRREYMYFNTLYYYIYFCKAKVFKNRKKIRNTTLKQLYL